MWRAPETIREMLERNVNDFPDREALVSVSYRTREWLRHTWGEMDEQATRFTAGLADLGVKKGEKDAFMLSKSVECYTTYLAIHKLGAVFVPINFAWSHGKWSTSWSTRTQTGGLQGTTSFPWSIRYGPV